LQWIFTFFSRFRSTAFSESSSLTRTKAKIQIDAQEIIAGIFVKCLRNSKSFDLQNWTKTQNVFNEIIKLIGKIV